MKGIIGCDADWMVPDMIVEAQGRRFRVIRKVDLNAAIEIARRVGDTSFTPVAGEHFYEIDLDLLFGTTGN